MRKPAPGRYRTLLHQTPNVALAILGALLLTGCGRQREDLVAAPSGFEKIGV